MKKKTRPIEALVVSVVEWTYLILVAADICDGLVNKSEMDFPLVTIRDVHNARTLERLTRLNDFTWHTNLKSSCVYNWSYT